MLPGGPPRRAGAARAGQGEFPARADRETPMADDASPDRPEYPHPRLGRLTAILEAEYGFQDRWSRKSPMDQLIATVLSQRTTYADERKAFDNLLARFGDWDGVARAEVADIEAEIRTSRYPEIKAPRIKALLETIIERHGSATLDHLHDMDVAETTAYLRALPGVGPKTSTFVQLFSMRRPVLPVDTHVHRTTQRLGIIGPKVTEARAHDLLLGMLPVDAGEILNFHVLYFKHGQKVCRYRDPSCGRCRLSHDCDHARANGRAAPDAARAADAARAGEARGTPEDAG